MDASTMTPLEAAEIIERGDCGQCRYDAENTAIRLLRAIAAGEYKQVVHAVWAESNQNNSYSCRLIKCSNCGETHIVPYTIPLDEWAKNRNYCGSCGSLMDGKDDSHEK
jgi:ribosomal protein S27AE